MTINPNNLNNPRPTPLPNETTPPEIGTPGLNNKSTQRNGLGDINEALARIPKFNPNLDAAKLADLSPEDVLTLKQGLDAYARGVSLEVALQHRFNEILNNVIAKM
jgi:hypothetical protein